MSDDLIIHTACGLPVEFCQCPDAKVEYDWERDEFREKQPPEEGQEDAQ